MINKKVSLTIGCAASGKSTWAKKQAATVIERDEIREFLFPGYWKQTPDSKKENIVTQEQERQILGAIKAGKPHIIISDTNLNQRYVDRILSLFEPAGYEVEFKYFDDSLSLWKCLSRNANRERKVPEEVICKQWKRYQILRNQHYKYRLDTRRGPVLFVSDVHGLYVKLNSIIAQYGLTHQIVLAGDLNDQRFDLLEDNFSESVSTFETLALVYEASQDGIVHLLHSNHQKNIINLCRGKRKKLSQGLQNSAAELTWQGLTLEFDDSKTDDEVTWIKNSWIEEIEFPSYSVYLREIVNFLDTRPSCYAMIHNGEDWRFAHGFVPKEQIEFNPFPAKDEPYIYGPHRPDSSYERLQWWFERENQDVGFKSCIGHQHEVFHGKNSIVCDPDDGNTLGLVFFEDGKEPRMEFV